MGKLDLAMVLVCPPRPPATQGWADHRRVAATMVAVRGRAVRRRGATIGDRWRTVSVRGPADLYAAPELKRLLLAAVDQGSGHLIVDLIMSAATLLDSSGLAALLGAHGRAQLLDGSIAVVNLDGDIARTLQITGLAGIFAVVGSLQQAVDCLQAAS